MDLRDRFDVPATNNGSESAIRGYELAAKVSGCWRTHHSLINERLPLTAHDRRAGRAGRSVTSLMTDGGTGWAGSAGPAHRPLCADCMAMSRCTT